MDSIVLFIPECSRHLRHSKPHPVLRLIDKYVGIVMLIQNTIVMVNCVTTTRRIQLNPECDFDGMFALSSFTGGLNEILNLIDSGRGIIGYKVSSVCSFFLL